MSDITPGKPVRTYAVGGKWRDWSTDEIVAQNKNYLHGWKCGAGTDSLFIDMDGDVWTASCRVGGKLGNVFDSVTTPTGWIECTKNVCSCGADLFIPKSKTIEIKNLSSVLRKTKRLPSNLDHNDNSQEDFVAMERTHASDRKQVYWELGRRCNYDCSYCWPWIHNNTDKHKSFSELMDAMSTLEDSFLKGTPANFIISGGEPTTNSAFLDLLRFLHTSGHHISLHSNGSRKSDYYEEVLKYGDLNLSVHFEFYDRSKFVDLVKALALAKGTSSTQLGHLEVKMMSTPNKVQESKDLASELQKLPFFKDTCTWAYVPIRGGLDNNRAAKDSTSGSEVMIGYTKADLKLFGAGKIDE